MDVTNEFYLLYNIHCKSFEFIRVFSGEKNSSISNVEKNIIYTIVMHVLYELRVRRPVFRPPNT